MKKITLLFISIFILHFSFGQCSEPTELQIANDWGLSFIDWDGDSSSNWDIEYGIADFEPTGVPTVENSSNSYYNFEMLTIVSENIDFYVRADCGDEVSDWVGPLTFYNYCYEQTDFCMYGNEDFENEFIPNCWIEANDGSPLSSISGFNESSWEASNFANIDSSIGAKVNISNNAVNEWLLFPISIIDIPIKMEEDNLAISFDVALTQAGSTEAATLGSDDKVQVVLSPDLGETWYTLYTFDTTSSISNIGETISFYYTDGMYEFYLVERPFLLGFWASSGAIEDTENVDFFIDNVSITSYYTGAINDLNAKDFKYYPNPSINTINISAKENINKMTIYNQLGQELMQSNINALQSQLDISELPKGVFFMKIQIGDTSGIVSLVKE